MENNNPDPSLLKQNSTQSRINEKPFENMKNSQISSEPFKITIDTQVIHKENLVPETKTYTTFHTGPIPSPVVNPIQR
jgi:hypothetical protein